MTPKRAVRQRGSSGRTYGLSAEALKILDATVRGVFVPPGARSGEEATTPKAIDRAQDARPYEQEQLLEHIGMLAAHDLLMELGTTPHVRDIVFALLAVELRRHAKQLLRDRRRSGGQDQGA